MASGDRRKGCPQDYFLYECVGEGATAVMASLVSNTAVAKRNDSQKYVEHLDFYVFVSIYLCICTLSLHKCICTLSLHDQKALDPPRTGVRDG